MLADSAPAPEWPMPSAEVRRGLEPVPPWSPDEPGGRGMDRLVAEHARADAGELGDGRGPRTGAGGR
jgi:hypothetical protein